LQIKLDGRLALVTGGASNIGRGITLALADAGAEVLIVDRDEQQAQATAALRPGRIRNAMCDLSDLAQVKALAERLARDEKVDLLVNNAGWVRSEYFAAKDLAEMDLELRLNLMAPLLLVRLLLPGMIERKWGRIVSVASEAGRAGQRTQVAYSAAKGGILGMTRSLSHEVGRHGITVNAVSPAMTIPESPEDVGQGSMQQQRDRPPEVMAKFIKAYPVGRVGHPRDLAAAVTFLCSEQAEFITGQTLPVNGGFITT
jgi:2-hydroxycyclohexanecarboxyl-CoA dehydrogenase